MWQEVFHLFFRGADGESVAVLYVLGFGVC
jgi:hypothetical protein